MTDDVFILFLNVFLTIGISLALIFGIIERDTQSL